MKTTRKIVVMLVLACFVPTLILGCGSTYVVKAPPAPIHEVRPVKPYPNAVWIEGHWHWKSSSDKYAWVPGRWKRTHRGHVWVKGHWR